MKLTLSKKLLIPIIGLIVVGSTVSATISYVNSKRIIENMTVSQIIRFEDSTAKQIGTWIKRVKLNVSSWAGEMAFKTAVQDTFLGESARESASERLSVIKENYEDFENLILFDAKGDAVASDSPEIVGSLNVSDRQYFKEVLDTGELVVSDVVESKLTGMPVFLISSPVFQYEGKIDGVLTVSVDMRSFSKMFIDPIKVGKKGYAYLFDAAGRVIAHPNKDEILKTNVGDSDFGREMMKNESGMITYKFQDREEMVAFRKIESMKNCTVAVVVNTAELFSSVRKIGFVNFISTFPMIILVAVIIVYIVRSITRPVLEVAGFARDLSEGNLTVRMNIGNRDEIGEMAANLDNAVSDIQKIMMELTDSAGGLTLSAEALLSVSAEMVSSAEDMKSKSDMAAASSNEISSSVNMVASAAEQSSSSITNIASMTEEMSSSFNSVAESAAKTAGNVDTMAQSGTKMSDRVDNVVSAMEQMTASLNHMAKNTVRASEVSKTANKGTEHINNRMETLVAASKRIGKIVGVIKDIADQTNMLALNATIEAAGAGDAGRGFAVVAGEVKELAKQSAEATDEIAGQIDEIQASVSEVFHSAEEISKVIAEAAEINEMLSASVNEQTSTTGEISDLIADTAETVKNVAENARESANLVGEIAISTDETSKTAAEISKNVEELARGVREVAKFAGDAAQGVNEINKNLQDINAASRQTVSGALQTSESSKKLEETASALSRIIKRFKV